MLDILAYEFMQRAIISGVVIAVACSTLGLFLVLRRYSLFGDVLAHTALSGIAVGIFLNVYPLITALLTSMLASIGITKMKSSTRLSGDTLIAMLLIGSLAVAIVMLSASNGLNVNLLSYLFGSILLIRYEDMIVTIIASIAVIAYVTANRDKLLYITMDEEQARLSGLNVQVMNYIFMALASIIVILAIRLVGVLLVSSLIVLPNIAGIVLGKGFRYTLIASPCIAVVAVVTGIVSSYYLNIAASGMIVITNLLITLCILAYKSFKGESIAIRQLIRI
jgi:zinc transport system permease protein